MKKGRVIVLDQKMVKSEVWLSLNGTAIKVYHIFRCKCQYAKLSAKRGAEHVNNGELVFTYAEAESKYSILPGRFKRAIDELVSKGFIDITGTGMGVKKVATTYGIAERWRDYGTSGFKTVKRPKRPIGNRGFRRGNKLWRRARKKNTTAKNAHRVMRKNVHRPVLTMRTNAHGEKVSIRYNWRTRKWLGAKIA